VGEKEMTFERKKILLGKLERKEITIDHFLYECCMWMMETGCFIEIEVRDYPVPPREFQEYLNLPSKERYKIPQEFFNQPSIKEYIGIKDKVYAQNSGDFYWLNECKSRLPDDKNHLEYHLKLDAKISEFKAWFRNTSPEIEKARAIFQDRGGSYEKLSGDFTRSI
jgi:hypothetical protein